MGYHTCLFVCRSQWDRVWLAAVPSVHRLSVCTSSPVHVLHWSQYTVCLSNLSVHLLHSCQSDPRICLSPACLLGMWVQGGDEIGGSRQKESWTCLCRLCCWCHRWLLPCSLWQLGWHIWLLVRQKDDRLFLFSVFLGCSVGAVSLDIYYLTCFKPGIWIDGCTDPPGVTVAVHTSIRWAGVKNRDDLLLRHRVCSPSELYAYKLTLP